MCKLMSTHTSSTFPITPNPTFHSWCKKELVSKPRRFLKCPLPMCVCMLLWLPRGHNPEKNYGLPVCSHLWLWVTGWERQMVSCSHKDSQLWEWERGGTSDYSHGVPSSLSYNAVPEQECYYFLCTGVALKQPKLSALTSGSLRILGSIRLSALSTCA